jgi:NDP-sugar pyrophosphorylase family protein
VQWDGVSRKVLSYQKNAGGKHTHMDAGVLAISKAIFQYFPKDSKAFSLEDVIFPFLIQKEQIFGYEVHQRFYDIGTFGRLELFKRFVK